MSGIIHWRGPLGGRRGSIDYTGEHNYTLRFVATTEPETTEVDILTDRLCPKVYSLHPNDALAVCTGVVPEERQDDPRVWDVTVEYSSKLDFPEKESFKTPIERAANITWGTWRSRQVLTQDTKKNPYRTTPGEPFRPASEIEKEYLLISIGKNVQNVPGWIDQYSGAINKDVVKIRGKKFPAKTLKFSDLSIGDIEYEYNIAFVRLQFNLYFNPDEWKEKRLHEGFREFRYYTVVGDGTAAQRKYNLLDKIPKDNTYHYEAAEIAYRDGTIPANPFMLDEYGRAIRKKVPSALTSNSLGIHNGNQYTSFDNNFDKAYYIERFPHKELPFKDLPLK